MKKTKKRKVQVIAESFYDGNKGARVEQEKGCVYLFVYSDVSEDVIVGSGWLLNNTKAPNKFDLKAEEKNRKSMFPDIYFSHDPEGLPSPLKEELEFIWLNNNDTLVLKDKNGVLAVVLEVKSPRISFHTKYVIRPNSYTKGFDTIPDKVKAQISQEAKASL